MHMCVCAHALGAELWEVCERISWSVSQSGGRTVGDEGQCMCLQETSETDGAEGDEGCVRVHLCQSPARDLKETDSTERWGISK